MPRVTPSAPALSRDLGAIPKLDDAPPPEYNEVIQEENLRIKNDAVRRDVESARPAKCKKSGRCARTLIVFKVILVLLVLVTFASSIFLMYYVSFFDRDVVIMKMKVENLERRQQDLYSTIFAMERRMDSNHPVPTTQPPYRPAQSHGFRNGWGGW